MEVKRKMKPGDPGTLKLLQQYGDKLICVRYRYDKIQHKRQTTVELLVDEQPWYGDINNVSKKRSPQEELVKVHVKIQYTKWNCDHVLRIQVESGIRKRDSGLSASGRWLSLACRTGLWGNKHV
jgi:hypothetical protein